MSVPPKIALVTDSAADIPAELAEQNQINVVPLIMVIDGESIEDGQGMSRTEFYERMPGMLESPTTATPSSASFQQVYERLLNGGAEQVISIHTASTLSGIFNAASLGAAPFEGRVQVVDSGQLTLGLGFQVLKAATAIQSGATLEQVLRVLKDAYQRARVIAMLDTLEYVRRSGRVSWARARLGALLNLKPFIEVRTGQVLRLGEARTRRNGIERLKQLILNLGAVEHLAVLHSNAEAEARQIRDEITQVLQPALSYQPLVVNVTSIIGVHIGPKGLGCAALLK
jgi:DegV family protein with EDD domain